ncbi:MAG: DNA polymerase I [SAR202 cluster bacterium]|nr:DNA polymerase I [SAR202 cluster bacterium]|tara:strand:+ start:17735 stop:20491 length:2757 start_codon:yes stop_codon:yes gene_type:complete
MTNNNSNEKNLLLIIDGHSIIYRAWHGIKFPMTLPGTSDPIHGVYGFTSQIFNAINTFNPSHCVVAFDLPKPTFRHENFKDYKKDRPKAPPELIAQFPPIKKIIKDLRIPYLELEGFEADDIIGTLSSQSEKSGIPSIILTSDSDTFQLVSKNVKVLFNSPSKKNPIYNIEMVKKRYGGLGPEYVADLKALEGDKSDSIPGVPGVGSKTAIDLLTRFGSIEGILENLDKITPPRIKSNLEKSQKDLINYKFLTKIVTDAPINITIEETKFWKFSPNEITKTVKELGFFSLINKIPQFPEYNQITQNAKIIRTIPDLQNICEKLSKAKQGFSFSVEIFPTNSTKQTILGISLFDGIKEEWYLPLNHPNENQIKLDELVELIQPIFENKSIPKITTNSNQNIQALSDNGIKIENLKFDNIIAAHLLGYQSKNITDLAAECLNHQTPNEYEIFSDIKKQISNLNIMKFANYSTNQSNLSWKLYSHLQNEIEKKKLTKIFYEIEMEFLYVLHQIQSNGIPIDSEYLNKMSTELSEEIEMITQKIYSSTGEKFNISSSQQLSEILFEKLNLPKMKKTKTGFSTDAASLMTLQNLVANENLETYKILENILKYRHLTKIKSTYVDTIPKLTDQKTGKLHTVYNQTGTTTGRISSAEPNVQNIPIKTDLGLRVRKAFITQSQEKSVLMSADYSQIELRVLAHFTKDQNLIQSFKNRIDIHSSTAAKIFKVPLEDISEEMRRIAKIMNFGVIYGLSPYGISQQTGLTPEEGKKFTETYFNEFPGILKYIEKTKLMTKKDGYTQTILGKRRYLPEINSKDFRIRSSAERMAINMPIQGTAAEIIKLAMINMQKKLNEKKLKSVMTIQVHDELIFEVPKDELMEMVNLATEIMSTSLEILVPLEIDIKTGVNWGQMTPINIQLKSNFL